MFCSFCDLRLAYGDDDVCDCSGNYCPNCLRCEVHCTCTPPPASVTAHATDGANRVELRFMTPAPHETKFTWTKRNSQVQGN